MISIITKNGIRLDFGECDFIPIDDKAAPETLGIKSYGITIADLFTQAQVPVVNYKESDPNTYVDLYITDHSYIRLSYKLRVPDMLNSSRNLKFFDTNRNDYFYLASPFAINDIGNEHINDSAGLFIIPPNIDNPADIKAWGIIGALYPTQGKYFCQSPYYYNGSGTYATDSNTMYNMGKNFIKSFWDGVKVAEKFPGDSSQPQGGGGNFDKSTDNIEAPILPTVNSLNTGFITAYHCTTEQINNFAHWLWTSDFFENVKKIITNPIDNVIGLLLLPISEYTEVDSTIKCALVDSGINAKRITSQYVDINFGDLKVDEYFGSALDYNPYTKIEIYLPYCGIKTLDVDVVMNSTINLTYRVDVLTGDTIILIKVIKNISDTELSSIMYHYNTNIAANIPFTGANFTEYYKTAISGIVGIASSVASGAAGIGSAVNSALNVACNKLQINKSSNINSNYGYMDVKYPYLIITRPIQSVPSNFKEYYGYPLNITTELNTLSGYTEVEEIHLEGLNLNTLEMSELDSLLKSGIIL